MKIIEAMKLVKMNDEKVADLRNKISSCAAHTSIENPVYGPETRQKIDGWLQACADISQQNVNLLCNIQRTNLATNVDIELGGKKVTKSIAEWVWRRRKYAEQDRQTWGSLTDRNLQEGHITPSNGTEPVKVEIVGYYDPSSRDEKVEMYREEPHRIDSALEVVNATTDLIEAA